MDAETKVLVNSSGFVRIIDQYQYLLN